MTFNAEPFQWSGALEDSSSDEKVDPATSEKASETISAVISPIQQFYHQFSICLKFPFSSCILEAQEKTHGDRMRAAMPWSQWFSQFFLSTLYIFVYYIIYISLCISLYLVLPNLPNVVKASCLRERQDDASPCRTMPHDPHVVLVAVLGRDCNQHVVDSRPKLRGCDAGGMTCALRRISRHGKNYQIFLVRSIFTWLKVFQGMPSDIQSRFQVFLESPFEWCLEHERAGDFEQRSTGYVWLFCSVAFPGNKILQSVELLTEERLS